MEKEIQQLQNKQNRLYEELTKTFTDKNQFRLLNELVETEIELESYCNR